MFKYCSSVKWWKNMKNLNKLYLLAYLLIRVFLRNVILFTLYILNLSWRTLKEKKINYLPTHLSLPGFPAKLEKLKTTNGSRPIRVFLLTECKTPVQKGLIEVFGFGGSRTENYQAVRMSARFVGDIHALAKGDVGDRTQHKGRNLNNPYITGCTQGGGGGGGGVFFFGFK